MNTERVLSIAAAVFAPIVGLLVQNSRRNRLLTRVETYLRLADTVERHDPIVAADLHSLANESVAALIQRDRKSLQRKLDPAVALGAAFFAVPGVIGLVVGFGSDDWWRWPAVVAGGVWAAICAGAVIAAYLGAGDGSN